MLFISGRCKEPDYFYYPVCLLCEPLEDVPYNDWVCLSHYVKCNCERHEAYCSWLPHQWWSQPAWCKKEEEQKDERATHRWKTKTDFLTDRAEIWTCHQLQEATLWTTSFLLQMELSLPIVSWHTMVGFSYDTVSAEPQILMISSFFSLSESLVGSDASSGVWV